MLLQIAALSMLVGGAVAPAQDAPADEGPLSFVRLDQLLGRDVRSAGGEKVGTVQDLVFDRGSGDIRYLVLERGGVIGVGARSVGVPWSHVAPAEAEPSGDGAEPDAVLVANATPEQLERMPEFDPLDPDAIQSGSWPDAMRSAFEDWPDWPAADRTDPLAGQLASTEEVTIEGEVMRVRRERGFEGAAEHVLVEVKTEDGRQTVALGPSWLIMSSAAAPLRGSQITIDGLALEQNDEIDAVARSFSVEGIELHVRAGDGQAQWAAAPASGGAAEDAGRLSLATDLVGTSATAHGKDAGEIKRLVLELTTGVVAFVELDPDANFLGMADNTRLAPWEVVTSVGAERVRLDASPQSLTTALSSPQRDEAAAWFAEQKNRDRVYKLFNVEPRRFEAPGAR